MTKIDNVQHQNLHAEAQPEPVDASEIGFLETIKPTHNWWYTDTVTTTNVSLPAVQPVPVDMQAEPASYTPPKKGLTEYISSLWSMLWKPRDASKPINAPGLAPEQIDEKTLKLFTDSLMEMHKRTQELDEEYKQFLKDDPAKAEAAIYKVLALLMKNQLQVNEEKALLTTRRVTETQKKAKQTNEDLFKLSEEKEWLSKNESRAKTAALFIGAAAGLAAFATLAIGACGTVLAVSSLGMVTMSPIITGITGTVTVGLNVASGAALVLKEYLTGKVNSATRESIVLQLRKELESEGITQDVKKVKDALEDIANYWSLMKDVAENHNQASKHMMRR
jgi:hypothetical protein